MGPSAEPAAVIDDPAPVVDDVAAAAAEVEEVVLVNSLHSQHLGFAPSGRQVSPTSKFDKRCETCALQTLPCSYAHERNSSHRSLHKEDERKEKGTEGRSPAGVRSV